MHGPCCSPGGALRPPVLPSARGSPRLALGRAWGPVPWRFGAGSGPRVALSAIIPRAPGPKAAAAGGESGGDVPRWWHLGAGCQADGSSPFSPARPSLFVSPAKTNPSVWDALLNVGKRRGGREAREIPPHGDTVREGGCAVVTLLTSPALCLPLRRGWAGQTLSEGSRETWTEIKIPSLLVSGGEGAAAFPPGAPCPSRCLVAPCAVVWDTAPVSVLRLVPWQLRVVTPRRQWPLVPAEQQRAMLRGFACLSLHSGDVPAGEGLSPESIITLCPLVGRRQTPESDPFPKPVGMQNRGLSWGWGLPAWPWVLAKVGPAWAAVGDPRGSLETRQSAVRTPGRGACPPGWV